MIVSTKRRLFRLFLLVVTLPITAPLAVAFLVGHVVIIGVRELWEELGWDSWP